MDRHMGSTITAKRQRPTSRKRPARAEARPAPAREVERAEPSVREPSPEIAHDGRW